MPLVAGTVTLTDIEGLKSIGNVRNSAKETVRF